MLTNKQVRAIREAGAAGTPQREIADTYRISQPYVSQLTRGISRAGAGGPIKPMSREKANETITDSDVEAIRVEYARGCVTQSDLAKKYGTQIAIICKIVRGDIRPQVGGPITHMGGGRRLS